MLPRVSEILAATGLATYPALSPERRAWYMARGKALHRAIELDATGELDDDGLHPEIAGAFRAYQKFCLDTEHVAWATELPLVSERYGFQTYGIDRVGLVLAEPTILDWKFSTSVDTRTVTLQLAAYDILYQESGRREGGDIEQHLAVLLHADGTYAVQPMRVREHRNTFLAAVQVYRALTAWSTL